ncbi:hypothetical protein M153_6999000201 [Pseudoloma neurophilia]|uniref:Uncharacterized protein n=1 Tax=Pseudoloma neurophilia TaxID=146866 RepID=A0A0R0LSB8_9MICR|nr:hypothetical protein M153_6999000201 [Pseudoloma neurophilia]
MFSYTFRHHIDFCDTFRQILYQISYCFIFKTSLKQSFSTSIKELHFE